MTDTKKRLGPASNDAVGIARSPGANRGKPRARFADLQKIDVAAILNAPVTMRAADGSAKKVSAFEARLRADVKRAIQDRNMTAAARVIAVFEKQGAFVVPKVEDGGGLIHARLDTVQLWHSFAENLSRYGHPPPWPGEDPDQWVGIVEQPDPRSHSISKRSKKRDLT